ncbi:hypothetical protein W97_08918 [Coniosporium apollinis CBS 100218]|uniref:Uncharacterized protein n=1 Tax=Coniosporium apollinis (strain CBS 100218) TaxID=1168221 RepID=R7Z6X8_CONA1|nr:uncharacterized protein W97_08918 [Coniosporium apollinis CBS 100218]EON69666.1 hypothetical protein W97_08918 [Coniosporium apollinis CBS 100218]
MCGSLIAGIALAIGHHFFYLRFDGMRVDGAMSQQWTNRYGTAFAFLVKMFLAIATGAAYVQQQWSTLQSRPIRIDRVDSMFGILGDATLFLSTRLWLKAPLLTLPALVTWLIPLAAIVTPGTLTVLSEQQGSIVEIQVPQLAYNWPAWAVYGLSGQGYIEPSMEVARIALATAMSGEILTIPSHHRNSTYQLQFFAPAIKCTPPNATFVEQIRDAFSAAYFGTGGFPAYTSWVADSPYYGQLNFSMGLRQEAYKTLDESSPDASTLYVMGNAPGQSTRNESVYVHECKLYNASYHVDLNFTYPSQSINLVAFQYEHPVRGWGQRDYDETSQQTHNISEGNARNLTYRAAMDAFGKVLVGEAILSHYGYTRSHYTLYAYTAINWTTAATSKWGLEQLFQNITLSFLSSKLLVNNGTDAEYVPVSVTEYHNIYVYNARDLLLPYGISIACAMLCVAVGAWALVRTGATYSNRFSTILRTTRDPCFDRLVDSSDDGSDPLPEKIAKAELALENGFRREREP